MQLASKINKYSIIEPVAKYCTVNLMKMITHNDIAVLYSNSQMYYTLVRNIYINYLFILYRRGVEWEGSG